MYGLAYIRDGAERIKLWREIHGAGVNGAGESHSSKASHGPLGTNPLFSYWVEVEVIQSYAVITSISSFH